jgi:hypothetical protein
VLPHLPHLACHPSRLTLPLLRSTPFLLHPLLLIAFLSPLPAHRSLPLSRRRSFLPRCHRFPPARRHLGLGSYAEWDEDKRLAFLAEELGGRRPLIPPAMPFSPDCKEVMETLK